MRDPLTSNQRKSGSFVLFTMTDHPDQADPNWKHSHMTCRACVKLPLDIDWIDFSIDTKIMKNSHINIVHLAAFYNGINPDIGTQKK